MGEGDHNLLHSAIIYAIKLERLLHREPYVP